MTDDFTRFRMAWLDQIYDDPDLTPSARDIAFRISRLFNRKRYSESGACMAWPSYETLARDAGCTAKTVQRAVALLKKCEHLETSGNGGRRCTLTYFALVKGGQSRSSKAENDSQKRGHESPRLAEDELSDGKKVDTGSSKGGHLSSKKVDKNVLQTSLREIPDEILDARCGNVQLSLARSPLAIIALSILDQGPTAIVELPPMLRGKEAQFRDLVLNEQAQRGWPNLHELCVEPHRHSEAMARLALEMEPVAFDSPEWRAWKVEYRRRGWPMPKPMDGIACFPACGPTLLDDFLVRVRSAAVSGTIDRSKNVFRINARRVAR